VEIKSAYRILGVKNTCLNDVLGKREKCCKYLERMQVAHYPVEVFGEHEKFPASGGRGEILGHPSGLSVLQQTPCTVTFFSKIRASMNGSELKHYPGAEYLLNQ